ncbi:hypothetical protein [Agrobacterium tumefaciens]|uniref:hypothetical protein n=1 Tax=Agrobacterium tumefaciens TaxID=358 RepID=UPI0015718D32|nr:hypothetical protein [Agrobacterium tumefaciens]
MTKRTRPYAIERYPLLNDWLVMPAFGPDENVTTSAAICTSRRTQLDRNHVLREYLPVLDRHVDVGAVEANEALQLGVDYRLPTGEVEEFRRDYRVISKSAEFIELEVHPSILSAIKASRKAVLNDLANARIGRQGLRIERITGRNPDRDRVLNAMATAEKKLIAMGVPVKARETSECVVTQNGVRVELRRFPEGWRLKRFERGQWPNGLKMKVPDFKPAAITGEAA